MGKVDEIHEAAPSAVEFVAEWTGREPKGPDGQDRYLALCIAHDDNHESMRIHPGGGFNCFTCGAKGGDVIDLYAVRHDLEKAEAIRVMHREYVGKVEPGAASPKLKKQDGKPRLKSETKQMKPRAIPKEETPRAGKAIELHFDDKPKRAEVPKHVYVYRDTKGRPFHAILRMESGGRKRFLPALWDGEKWWAKAQPTPRKLYGLDQIGTSQQVLVVEGEKAADAAREALPAAISVVTWPGGASAIGSIDWSPLHGKNLVLWPDNDAAGQKAMEAIAKRLAGDVGEVKMVDPSSLVEKGDAADVEGDMLAWLKAMAGPWIEPDEAEEEVLDRAIVEEELADEKAKPIEQDAFASPEEVKERRNAVFPFHILGQHEERAYFLKRADGRMLDIALMNLGKKDQLCTIARPDVWQKAFGGTEISSSGDSRPIPWPSITSAAQAHIMDACESLPEFDPTRTRGRGCWPHKESVAFNRGDLVMVGGELAEDNYVDAIVYERGRPLAIETQRQLTDDEGGRLIDVLEQCTWRDGHAAIALAGWIALAPICGAIPWRPHVWITGPSGSGKSTVMNDIVLPAIGRDLCIRLAGNTTEAGLRQVIKRDSLPILLDEAESDARSMKAILDLARSASTGDTVVRGTSGGEALVYHIRNGFCFSSINPTIAKAADESRISPLQLVRSRDPQADEKFQAMRDEIANLIDEEFGARLTARMIASAEQVLANIAVMEDAVTRRFGSRRLAQQWGALLTGAWHLTQSGELDDKEADGMARFVPDGVARIQLEEDDAFNMVSQLCAYQVEVSLKTGKERMAISELIYRLASIMADPSVAHIDRGAAEDALARVGLKVSEGECLGRQMYVVLVAYKHVALIDRVFGGTPWSRSYTERFRDIEGASAGPQTRFAGQRRSTTMVPADYFIGGRMDDE